MAQRPRTRPQDLSDREGPTLLEDYGSVKQPRIWEQVPRRNGAAPLAYSPEALWEKASQYFEWVEANPLLEAKAFAYEGVVQVKAIPKMRAYTLHGLCLYLGISRQTFHNYLYGDGQTGAANPDLRAVAELISECIREQKFVGAAADLLNAGIIARDLGLADKVENKVTLNDERTPDQVAASIKGKLDSLAAKFREDPLL